MRTILSKESDGSCNPRTVSAQFLNETEHRKMRFPLIIKHRRFEATIYGKSEKYLYYRVSYYSSGKRHIRNFKTFSEAKTKAESIVRNLADGSQSVALSANQSRDALPGGSPGGSPGGFPPLSTVFGFEVLRGNPRQATAGPAM